MREKIIILSILLLSPLYTYGEITVNCPNTQDPDTCWQVAGCEFISSGYNSRCKQCSANSYCPGGTSQNTNKADCPTNAFPKSPNGSTSINDCYKQTANPGDGGCVTSDGTPNLQCGLFYPNSIPKCWDNNGEYSTDYHTEPSSGETCYANYLTCSYFTNNNCDSGATISGIARFYPSEGEWDIDNCQCGATQFTDNINKFCIGVSNGTSPTVRWIDLVTDYINYAGTSTGYYCTRCIPDNGNTKYYANTTFSDGTQCSPNTAQGRVCKCETSTYYGYYRMGKCCTSANNCPEWGNATKICKRTPCDIPGTTTTELLPISTDNSVCKYTSQTQLCDSRGCFTLGDLANTYGISVDGWVRVP